MVGVMSWFYQKVAAFSELKTNFNNDFHDADSRKFPKVTKKWDLYLEVFNQRFCTENFHKMILLE